ncbi:MULTISPECIES: heavy metal translocating P-type ATPase [unclassified Fusibacter]|uniref:heavy metal translocating P-type ATPase n=1 Tax=unclassified Fusibacter TaxID=2624464 RepID=UPI0013E99B09|nr:MULTISPECIES: heavy metal translocating P-type ATPase [unclassified Fusibacter]MCK8061185.1 cadmium-translocating P-type ATPase [Fusibacter sp. A2]NPE23278.1 cadmium-translocating P-type ATPase [Fusibacter sp. A1]
MKRQFKLKHLTCSGCAEAIQRDLKGTDDITNVSFNFATGELTLDLNAPIENLFAKVQKIVHSHEEEVEIIEKDDKRVEFVFLLEGLTCAGCTEKIMTALRRDEDYDNVSYQFATGELKLETSIKSNLRSRLQTLIDGYEDGVTVVPSSRNIIQTQALTVKKKTLFEFSRKQRVTIGAVGFIIGILSQSYLTGIEIYAKALMVFAYLVVGYPVIRKAFKNIGKGQWFDENFLMTIATAGAFILGELPEAVGVMLFYEIGELFQDKAVNQSRGAIKSLLAIRPDRAHLMIENEERDIAPELLNEEDLIVVKPGERVPVDGVIENGAAYIDTSALTGESVPVYKAVGETLFSGFLVQDSVLTLRVKKVFSESTASKIIDLVQNATASKATTEQFITKFARIYTPAVVVSAAMIALIVPLFTGFDFSMWIYRALIFLVISCPCALVVSIPLSYFGGLGAASKHGILIKGGNYLEALSGLSHIVFDKTGTLTKGEFKVTKVETLNGFTEEEVLEYAAVAEIHSTHPIAKAIVEAHGKRVDKLKDYKELSGKGIVASDEALEVVAGKRTFVAEYLTDTMDIHESNLTEVYIAVNKKLIGILSISDSLKEGSKQLIESLTEKGISVSMLTGDKEEVAGMVAEELGIANYYSGLMPEDKLKHLVEIIDIENGHTAFVGDGINDAPVLARADIGVAMGGLGSEAAIEAADVVLMNDDIERIIDAIAIAKRTRTIVYQNIFFALGVKVAFLVMGVAGLSGMWEAVFADVGVALLAVLNASRVMKFKK